LLSSNRFGFNLKKDTKKAGAFLLKMHPSFKKFCVYEKRAYLCVASPQVILLWGVHALVQFPTIFLKTLHASNVRNGGHNFPAGRGEPDLEGWEAWMESSVHLMAGLR
jgi:hypothetical protein